MTNLICWLTRRRLGGYLDGELASTGRTRTAAHLARCRDCAAELAVLTRLRAALAVEAPEPSAAVWQAFWPQVRARIASAPAPARPAAPWEGLLERWRLGLERPRLAFGSAVAVIALALLAVLAPWQRAPERAPVSEPPRVAAPEGSRGGFVRQVVVQSVETADPQSSVMVFSNADADVVWVFGLPRTDS